MGVIAAALSLPGLSSVSKAEDESTLKTGAASEIDPDAKLDTPVKAIVIGAGSRGRTYSSYASRFPGSLQIVGVADINSFRKKAMAKKFNVPEENQLGDWTEVFKRAKFADAVIICTPDNLHYEPCLKALDMGYHVLLEKPAAQSEQECMDIMNKSIETGKLVVLCHVLRYAPYFAEMRNVVQSGALGKIISVQHLEPIEAVHMSHSYVRGNWHNSKTTTPIILSKSCHDLDILRWVLGKKCKEVSAFGSVALFKKENAPEGCGDRCLDCQASIERECPFSAKRIYLERRAWNHVFDLSGSKEEQENQIREYLKTSNYGRCVYKMENDQCDHYVMNMKFEDDITAAFSMEGLTSYGGRFTRIMGSKGDLVGDMRSFTVTDFLTHKKTEWKSSSYDGHGGGDWLLVKNFITAVSANDPKAISSTIQSSIESHIMGYRAEMSRKNGQVVKMPDLS